MKTTEELIHDTVVEIAPNEKPDTVEKMEKILRAIVLDGVAPKEAMGVDQKTLEMIYDLAYQHYNSGKFNNALLLFIFLSGIDPKDFRYRMGVAASLHMNKQYQEAIEAYLICNMLEPMNPVPFYHLSDCFIQLKDPFRAMYFLKMSIAQAQSDPTRYATLIERGNMACKSIVNDVRKIPQLENLHELLPLVILGEREMIRQVEEKKKKTEPSKKPEKEVPREPKIKI